MSRFYECTDLPFLQAIILLIFYHPFSISDTSFQVLIFATVYSGIKFATTTIYNVIFQKLETGVFQTKQPDFPGAYSFDRFMEIIKGL